MEASPICRGKNLTLETVMAFVNAMPKERMPKKEFHAFAERRLKGWTQTHSQIARQLALYYEEDGECIPRFCSQTTSSIVFEYIKHWATLYYVPNLYTPSLIGYNPTNLYAFLRNKFDNGESSFSKACLDLFGIPLNNTDKVRVYLNNFTDLIIEEDQMTRNKGIVEIEYPPINPQIDNIKSAKDFYYYFGDTIIAQPNKHSQYNISNPLQQIFNITPVLERILSTGLIYSPTLIKRLAFSMMAKPFVILSGLAGSGKTQLALAFAKCLSENIEEQVCTVSIGADWTNREPLLGYPNALKENEYVLPESGVLQLLMRANEDQSKPYFLILDEMNLSVVERYFADFLSAMESGEPIKLWDNEEGNVPKEIELPKNVFIIGTINVDETTYMFSPKVLDRANVIEFKIAPDEMEDYLGKKVKIDLENAYSACADMAVDFVNKANSQVEKDEKNKDVLLSFFKELKKVNAEFGYRTVNEISRYLHFADGDLKDDSAIDTAILQKLLPKLHGSRKKLVPVLTSLWQLCLNDGVTKEIDTEFNKDDFKYPESAEKIQRMYNAVVDNGFTSFAEA